MSSIVKLNSRIEGEGPAIVLMHGLFGSHRNWFSVQRQLAISWQVHALDLRNHGGSPWADEMSYQAMADDVQAYLVTRQIESAVILGHSMGGKVAMSIAAQAPGLVRALVVVDIAPVVYQPSLRPFLSAMMALDLKMVSRRSDADRALSEGVPDPMVRGFLLQNLVGKSSAYEWRINLSAIDHYLEQLGEEPAGVANDRASVDSGAGRYGGPVLSIYGDRSEYMRPPHRERLAQVFPTTQFLGIANAGHWVHAEQA
ncbi:MAG: alpha/beta fold hydrolase, partial [Burkholderiaceae bacterium]